VNLVAGDQRDVGYAALNPIMGVPTLVLGDGTVLTQSLAILDYLDATEPEPPLLPSDPLSRARVLSAALTLAVDVHPVNNLRVTQKLKTMGQSQDAIVAWMNGWTREGLEAFAALAEPDTRFAFGAAPGFADICLVAQLYNAHRWGTDLSGLDRLTDIEAACLALPAFQAAHPDAQPDAQPDAT
ncbi:MAG: maleylacetoacetate isomerase, partial [Pseudomonadota bacterium]